jgi:CDGSH-type Zn-finger protein
MTDESNILIVQIDGPNLVTGDVRVVTATRVRILRSAMLCRCGRSLDKPFCDGAHVKCGFRDPAILPTKIESLPVEPGALTIRPIANGPNRCEGPLVIRGADGRAASASLTFLCRCGHSRRKPYCDGTHMRIAFRDGGAGAGR